MKRSDYEREVDETAANMIAQGEAILNREGTLKLKRVLCDGTCRIVAVAGATEPALARVYTDLGEFLPVFREHVAGEARRAIGRRVKLELHVSEAGTRYVAGLSLLPTNATFATFPCAHCKGDALRSDDRRFYRCPECHYQMEVAP